MNILIISSPILSDRQKSPRLKVTCYCTVARPPTATYYRWLQICGLAGTSATKSFSGSKKIQSCFLPREFSHPFTFWIIGVVRECRVRRRRFNKAEHCSWIGTWKKEVRLGAQLAWRAKAMASKATNGHSRGLEH